MNANTIHHKIGFLYTNKVALILTTGVILIQYFLPRDEYRTIAIYLVLLPIFVIYRFDSRILIVYSISLLVLSAVIYSYNFPYNYYYYPEFSYKESDIADQLAITSYYLLLVGVACTLAEFFRNINQDN
jgi:hypothetical protein